MGESNIASRHQLGSKIEIHTRDEMEVNWLIRGSDLHRKLLEILRIENLFMETGDFNCH
jgi:hypothetical protein